MMFAGHLTVRTTAHVRSGAVGVRKVSAEIIVLISHTHAVVVEMIKFDFSFLYKKYLNKVVNVFISKIRTIQIRIPV